MIALTSRCPHSGVSSSSSRPEIRFSTPPGMSETPATSPRSSARSGLDRETIATTVLPAAKRRGDLAHQAQQVGRVRREHRDHARRLRRGERQERRRDRVHAAHHRGELVRPARVVDEQVDRLAVLVAPIRARLERLREPVQHLPAVVGRLLRPPAGGGACDLDGVTHVLARAARHVHALDRVGPAGLRTHERASQVELVRLGDRRAGAHPPNLTYGASPAGPPSRPNPLSL